MAKTVKMQDIAEKLGGSTMTVSKALSGKPGVSEAMREKITVEENVPIVYVDFYDNCIYEDCVVSDSFYGSYAITNYLFEKGHSRIGFVGTLFSTKSITDRFMGYEKAMIEHGEKVREEWIIPDREQARNSYEKITLPMEMPTAFVCNCDLTASKLIRSLHEKGYRVPEDISVVGYDDFLYPGLCDVEITTYGVDMEHMAKTTFDVMLKRISGDASSKGIHVIEGYVAEKSSVLDIRQNS